MPDFTPLIHIDGQPIRKGDMIYSTMHKQYDTVKDVVFDDHGIAYIVFENIGQVSRPYCKVFH